VPLLLGPGFAVGVARNYTDEAECERVGLIASVQNLHQINPRKTHEILQNNPPPGYATSLVYPHYIPI
jgi:hypothetical protein